MLEAIDLAGSLLLEARLKEVGRSCVQKEARATEGAKAMAEYNAEREAERAKTERLRALQLAKEAAGKSKK